MSRIFRKFCAEDNGAVTVDWVVLTAAVVGLAGAIIVTINGSTASVGDGVGNYLATRPVGE